MQFNEAVDSLYAAGRLLTKRPAEDNRKMLGPMDCAAFNAFVDGLAFQVHPSTELSQRVDEEEMIPLLRDVYIIRHPRYTRPYLHRHNYVELDYVAEGRCVFHFEREIQVMEEGDTRVIAPYSAHDIEIPDESTVFCIMLRRSTFETAFFSLLSHDDVLSMFFRMALREQARPNYLHFHVEERSWMRVILQNALNECFKTDGYSNSCCIGWINILLGCLLRSQAEMPDFHDCHLDADFSQVLHYIRHNYQTLTLTELSERFHYSKPHLCTLIKQNTGVSLTAMLRQLRMSKAVEYLRRSHLSVSEIAELVGYHSADHFSRVFRGTYGISPQEYRRQHAEEGESFVPFRME